MRMSQVQRSLVQTWAFLATVILVMAMTIPASAQQGRINISIVRAGLVVGGQLGSGTITVGKKSYPISISGLGLGYTFGASVAKLSGTVQAAHTARQSLAKPERIELVDSQAASMAMGLAIIEAAEASRAGAKLAEVKAAAESAVQRTHVLFMLDTLEYLRRGGRIGRARAYLGALLSVKPILTLREGEVYPEERVRTRTRGLERIIQSGIRHQNVKLAAVGHSTTPDDAESIRERLAMAFPNVKVHLIRFGPVIGTHGGPGLVGVGVMEGE